MRRLTLAAVALLTTFGSAAMAADADDANESKSRRIGAGAAPDQLPAPQDDDDPRPPVAKPAEVESPGIAKQAGIGGPTAYGRPGVLELGGSAGFGAANNYTRFELSPSIGYFVIDNLQLSLLGAFNYFQVDAIDGNESASATEMRVMFEPSYHMPFSNALFGFAGLGAGVNYVTGHDAGFAWQPRLGLNIMVGRSGVLTPAVQLTYSTVEALRTEAGTLLAVQTTYGFNIGYTAMW